MQNSLKTTNEESNLTQLMWVFYVLHLISIDVKLSLGAEIFAFVACYTYYHLNVVCVCVYFAVQLVNEKKKTKFTVQTVPMVVLRNIYICTNKHCAQNLNPIFVADFFFLSFSISSSLLLLLFCFIVSVRFSLTH